MTTPAVHVLGSLNMDLVVRVPRHVRPGQTITGGDLLLAPGGKGANQAVAAARMGAPTFMHGCIGDDPLSPRLLASVRDAGVDVAHLRILPGVPCGTALIAIDQAGENCIVVSPGANGHVGQTDVQALSALLRPGDLLLMQLEIPLPAVLAAAEVAVAAGARVVLDPAPVRDLPPELLRRIDILTPNQSEASALCGFTVQGRDDAERAVRHLLALGVRTAIVKLGGDGAVYNTPEGAIHHLPALPARVVDTVAAGDAFNGGLAGALAAGKDFTLALDFARGAAALCVERHGAQQAMPTLAEVLQRLESART